MRALFILLLLSVFLSACQKPAANTTSPDAKRYPFKGKVISVDPIKKTATIDHEDIPGFMSGMKMAFPIHENWVWSELKPGAGIEAELVVDNKAVPDPFWLEKITIVSAPDPNAPTPTPDDRIGKTVPDFSLTNQDGKRISPKDFRGKAWAITFIYARCPLPDYCIRMSSNFSDLANRIRSDAELKDKIRLLSISFDSENDTPEKLRQYGAGYLGNQNPPDFSIWKLAVGSDKDVRPVAQFFGLDYRPDENNNLVITHNLRTAVIGPDGKVRKVIDGNEWTPDDLLNDLKTTVK